MSLGTILTMSVLADCMERLADRLDDYDEAQDVIQEQRRSEGRCPDCGANDWEHHRAFAGDMSEPGYPEYNECCGCGYIEHVADEATRRGI